MCAHNALLTNTTSPQLPHQALTHDIVTPRLATQPTKHGNENGTFIADSIIFPNFSGAVGVLASPRASPALRPHARHTHPRATHLPQYRSCPMRHVAMTACVSARVCDFHLFGVFCVCTLPCHATSRTTHGRQGMTYAHMR